MVDTLSFTAVSHKVWDKNDITMQFALVITCIAILVILQDDLWYGVRAFLYLYTRYLCYITSITYAWHPTRAFPPLPAALPAQYTLSYIVTYILRAFLPDIYLISCVPTYHFWLTITDLPFLTYHYWLTISAWPFIRWDWHLTGFNGN